ncbi:hypothetical protein TRFO_06260 [Tritrichomonas foetus]|uniref:Leucine Rich Repeat family protein n=1 Tax=Tritrichomonas foetus TaxID=1144522 RepID=A0A1J4K5P7_9EUKA|nr:hypothetical protein TRFO_06260 [Tritrichomonas foetus]|eukprot:OHT04797.1 hypothetical protein TRFO_06260 [Tritrichomonas foetus]
MDDSSYYTQSEVSESVTGTESVTESVTESANDDETESPRKETDGNEEETKDEHPEEEEQPKISADEARQKVLDMLHDGTIVFPDDFSNDELLAFLENIDFPTEISDESIEQYHGECVAQIREELCPLPEKPDEEDEESIVKLTPQFIADRLSNLEEVEGEHLTFALTSFAVQGAEIYDISALATYEALTYIKLKQNIISDASALNGLPRLKELYLSENKLISFSEISLPSLEILDLSQNQFRTLGKLSLPKLKKLILSQNRICYVAPSAYSETPELKELVLTENKIKAFKPNTFKNLGQLESLTLDQNQFTEINETTFEGLSGLKKLIFNENNIESIKGINVLTSLETLELKSTAIMELEELKQLIDLKSLKSINFDGSPVDGNENFKSDIILMLPWLETFDDEGISFSDRQEALQLDEERKAEAERARLEAEQEAAERAAAENEENTNNEEEDKSDSKTDGTGESYSTYYDSDTK